MKSNIYNGKLQLSDYHFFRYVLYEMSGQSFFLKQGKVFHETSKLLNGKHLPKFDSFQNKTLGLMFCHLNHSLCASLRV
jgi:hypothetical protein